MTDNEIVKALECCINTDGTRCGECEFFDGYNLCIDDLQKESLDLINRQKAEIEQLKEIKSPIVAKQLNTENNIDIAQIKAEAYREFAERLEKELFIKQNEHREHWMETLNRHRGTEAYKDHEWSIDNWLRGYGEAVQDILAINQNFLKELVGEDDG